MMHPYFPLIDGSYSDFAVFDIEGDPAKGGGFNHVIAEYGITSQTPHPNSPQRISIRAVDFMRKMIYHTPATPPPAVGGCLFEAIDGNILGEIGGLRVAQQPPIPLIYLDAQPGDLRFGVSKILHFDHNAEPQYKGDLPTRHWTKHSGQPWGPHQDTLRTILVEDNEHPHPKVAYMYVFARNIGLVDFYRALYDDITGWLYDGQRYWRIGPSM